MCGYNPVAHQEKINIKLFIQTKTAAGAAVSLVSPPVMVYYLCNEKV